MVNTAIFYSLNFLKVRFKSSYKRISDIKSALAFNCVEFLYLAHILNYSDTTDINYVLLTRIFGLFMNRVYVLKRIMQDNTEQNIESQEDVHCESAPSEHEEIQPSQEPSESDDLAYPSEATDWIKVLMSLPQITINDQLEI